MIINNEILKKISRYYDVALDKEFIKYIFKEYGVEQYPYIWTEQDLYEQISKLVKQYKNTKTKLN